MADPDPVLPSADDLALGEEAPVITPDVTPDPVDPPAPADEPIVEEEETPPDPDEEPEVPPTPRENKRIQAVLKKLADAQARPVVPEIPKPGKPNEPIIGEGEYDIDQINKMAEEYAQRRYEAGAASSNQRLAETQNAIQFQTRLELDAPKVTSKYEFLNQDSDKFDPGAASFINEMFLKTVGYNPQNGTAQNQNIRYDEFVEGIVELRETLAAAKVVDSQANIASQAARTGVRPGGGTAKSYSGTDPSKMTDEQLEAEITASLAALPRRR